MSTDSTLGVNAMKPHPEFYFRDGNVFFLVENTVFRLHRLFFERESDFFRSKLDPSTGEGEGNSPDSPYKIDNITSDEFAQLVWIWYNPQYSFANQGKEKWLTILRLASQWRFHEIRKLAIRHLEKVKFDPVEKIVLYKEYMINNDLLLPSYVSLCTNKKLPSPEEGNKLTMETVLRLADAREQVLLRASELGCRTPTIASAPEDVVKAVVTEFFGLSLHSNDGSVRVEGQATTNGGASGDKPVDTDVITVKQPNVKGKEKSKDGEVLQGPGPAPAVTNGVGGKRKHK